MLCSKIFNARAQRSWRRRSWHRPRTPSSSPSSPSPSRRRERLDTIRARITKFGPEVEIDEIAQIPNLTSLATSVRPLAAIFKTIYQISRSNISGSARHKCTKFEQLIVLNVFYIPFKFDRYCSLRSPV